MFVEAKVVAVGGHQKKNFNLSEVFSSSNLIFISLAFYFILFPQNWNNIISFSLYNFVFMVFSLIHSSILALIQSTANERVSRSQCSQRKVFPLHNSTTSLLEYVFPTNFFHQQHPSFSIFHWSARRGCGVLDNCQKLLEVIDRAAVAACQLKKKQRNTLCSTQWLIKSFPKKHSRVVYGETEMKIFYFSVLYPSSFATLVPLQYRENQKQFKHQKHHL